MAEGTVNNKYVNGTSMFLAEFTVVASMTNNQVTTPVYGFPFRVIDAWAVQTAAGGAGDTATVKAVATDGSTERSITDAMDLNKADTLITRAGALVDSAWDVLPNEALRVETASDATAKIFVLCAKLPQ